MTSMCNRVKKEIYKDYDPYEAFNASRFSADLQGWNSDHIFLSDTITKLRPKVVVEIGVWKGGSTICMANAMRDASVDGVVISVDTFLGSWEHYEQKEHFPSLMHQNGYPTLFYTFLTNVVRRDLNEYVIPLALDSANANFVLSRKNIRPDVIHIDAGHEHAAVLTDLTIWWPLLSPGGFLIADDYDTTGVVWPSVRDAVDEFLAITPHASFEALPFKARWQKLE